MKKTLAFIILITTSTIVAYCQVVSSTLSGSNPKDVSIYEYGDSLTSCETNFENLMRNWNNGPITNKDQYKFGDYYFFETISDSATYKYYRNYFSGLDVVVHTFSTSGSISYNGKEWETSHDYYLNPYKQEWILLNKKMPLETKIKILKLFNTELELNADTSKIKTVFRETNKTIEEIQDCNYSYSDESEIEIWAYSDSETKETIDSVFLNNLSFEDLDIQTQEEIQIKLFTRMRVEMQKHFNEKVHIGDKVYVVPFIFGLIEFKIVVICNPQSKKVVMDSFFKNVPY
jgi:hypothetical protein